MKNEESNWNDEMNKTAQEIWVEQDDSVRKQILLNSGLEHTLSVISWDGLTPNQKTKIEKNLV